MILSYYKFFYTPPVTNQTNKPATTTEAVEVKSQPKKIVSEQTKTQQIIKVKEEITKSSDIPELPIVDLSNEDVELKINPNKGCVKSYFFKKYLRRDEQDELSSLQHAPAPGSLGVVLSNNWRLIAVNGKKSTEKYTLIRTFEQNSKKVELIQVWTLLKNYQLDYQIKLVNKGSSTITIDSLGVMTPALAPVHTVSGDIARSEHIGVDYMTTKDDFNSVVSKNKKEDTEFEFTATNSR